MRKTALAGLLVMIIMATGSSKASAETLGLIQSDNQPGIDLSQAAVLAPIEQIETAVSETTKEPEVQKYKVADNDSLSKIAEAHGTTWKRLFDKNEAIPHPDLIKPGDELVIPRDDEIVKERPLPELVSEPVVESQPIEAPTAKKSRSERRAPARQTVRARGSSSGNGYVAGYCTWYAKNRRPDLPNNLGNANTWVSRARAQGITTGSTPRVGAIGQQGMHVVYVESVNGDGTVTVSEMNFRGRGVISSRTVPASYFQYIY